MKKILIALAFVMPLFLSTNIVRADGDPNQPNFYVYAVVSNAPAQCPSTGKVNGYEEDMGNTQTSYNGPTTVYVLGWNSSFPGPAPVTVSITTDTDSEGYSCFGHETKTLTGSDYGTYFYLDLILQVPPPGGGGNTN